MNGRHGKQSTAIGAVSNYTGGHKALIAANQDRALAAIWAQVNAGDKRRRNNRKATASDDGQGQVETYKAFEDSAYRRDTAEHGTCEAQAKGGRGKDELHARKTQHGVPIDGSRIHPTPASIRCQSKKESNQRHGAGASGTGQNVSSKEGKRKGTQAE